MKKSVGLAALLGFLWMGLGNLYAGEVGNGLVMMFIVTPVMLFVGYLTCGLGLLLIPVMGIMGGVGAAELYNKNRLE